METDGEPVVLIHMYTRYDEPEPMGCRILRGFLEQESQHMRTVRFIVQPGTDEEATYEARLMANHGCSIYDTSGVPFVFFFDEDATIVNDTDLMTDTTTYLFRNPDEELAERFRSLTEPAE